MEKRRFTAGATRAERYSRVKDDKKYRENLERIFGKKKAPSADSKKDGTDR